jgi:hypothetical protein
MKHALFAVLLVSAVSASAQFAGVPQDDLPSAIAGAQSAAAAARALSAKMTPAPVDPKPVAELFERLSKDGAQIETEQGVEDAYQRFGLPDKRGSLHNMRVGVVETEGPADEGVSAENPMYRDLVMRRYFSELEAHSEDWTVGKDGTGQVDIWQYSVSLDGKLVAVKHGVIPLVKGPDGKAVTDDSRTRVFQMSPSDKGVLKRWKKLTKQLLTLGRTSEA